MTDVSAHPMIEAKELSKYFGMFMAVKDISFSIFRGQIAAFLGPNGAGKTTTMRMLTGFLRPSEGSASIAGLDITRHRLEAVRKLGYLPENGPLYENMTPLDLLHFFAEARGLRNNNLKQRIEIVSEQCSLHNVLEKPIGKLSRGYRQRVGLAQALLHDPEVLIMDEPTAGLDPNQIREFRSHITSLAKSKTILLSTHILQEADAVADRILLVNNGQLIFDGPSDELRQGRSMEESFYQMTDYGKAPNATDKGGAVS